MSDHIDALKAWRFLLETLTAVVKETVDVMSIDAGSPEWEHTVDTILSLVKQDIMTEEEKE